MKLKEAQMLGVLALIAVGIILLCMWGGQGDSAAPTAKAEQAKASSQPALEPDLAELYNEILTPSAAAASSSQTKDATASMSIGGLSPAAPPAPAASEDAKLRTMIERVSSDRIPLTPSAAEPTAPSVAVQAAAAAAPASAMTHVVSAGETLSAISQKYYGTTSNWKAILDANASVLKDPRDLKPNMRLTIPTAGSKTASAPAQPADQATVLSAKAPAPAAGASVRTHTVVKGDTLFRIALKYYGDGSRYRDILAANRSLLKNPQDLRPGMKLVIP